MLQARRGTLRLVQCPYHYQWRGYTDTKPPNPTSSVREPDDKPVNEPIGVCLQFGLCIGGFANIVL